MVDFNTPESWDEARKIAGLVGEIPTSFSTCIRFLTRDAVKNTGELSRLSQYCVLRLLNSASVLSPVFYALASFKPAVVLGTPALPPKNLVRWFKPEELSTVLALIYLFRRIKRGCPEAQWGKLTSGLFIHSDIGGSIGVNIPRIGLGFGLLVGTMRHLAMAMFLGIDEKNFAKYEKILKNTGKHFDCDFESMTWGCNHAQVSAILAQTLGLGVPVADSLNPGLLPGPLEGPGINEVTYRTRLTSLWISTMLSTGLPPDITHKGEYYPLGKNLAELTKRANEIKLSGSKHFWVGRGKDDIGPQKTPSLFAKATESAQVESPEDILNRLSDEERQQVADVQETDDDL